jgi:hypothetical protein
MMEFFNSSAVRGPPPKVERLRNRTHPTRDAECEPRREAIRIPEFVADRELGILVLDRDEGWEFRK